MSTRIETTKLGGYTFNLPVRFKYTKTLGQGVMAALDREEDRTVAIKKALSRRDWDDETCIRTELKRIKAMKILGKHPIFVSFYNASRYSLDNELYIVMERMDCDLDRVIRSKQDLTEPHIKYFMKQLLEAVREMHAIGIVHTEIDTKHLLVDSTCELRLSGVQHVMLEGSERLSQQEEDRCRISGRWRWYRAPEVILCPSLPHAVSADMFSVGCVLAELFLRKPLFPGDDYIDQVKRIFKFRGHQKGEALGFTPHERALMYVETNCVGAGTPLNEVFPTASVPARDLLRQLLTVNPLHRITAEQALKHPFLEDAGENFDFSHTYLTRPPADCFAFERCEDGPARQRPATLNALRAMLLQEIAPECMGDEAWRDPLYFPLSYR